MQTILITWATGFLGSHIAKKLALIDDVYLILLKREKSDLSRLWNITTLTNVHIFQVTQEENIKDLFEKYNITSILHCATQYGRAESSTINEIVQTNLVLPLKLMDYSVQYKVRNFYNIDTFYEIDMVLPGNLQFYVLSKKQLIDYAKRIAEYHLLNFINLKLFHLFWPWDSKEKFLWNIIHRLLHWEDNIELTAWKQERDFIYVDDAARMICDIMQTWKNKWYQNFDIWTWNVMSLEKFLVLIKNFIDPGLDLNFWVLPYRQGDPMYSCADISNEYKDFIFTPIDIAIKETIDFYK
jgi:CDP-paratose synthetase